MTRQGWQGAGRRSAPGRRPVLGVSIIIIMFIIISSTIIIVIIIVVIIIIISITTIIIIIIIMMMMMTIIIIIIITLSLSLSLLLSAFSNGLSATGSIITSSLVSCIFKRIVTSPVDFIGIVQWIFRGIFQ